MVKAAILGFGTVGGGVLEILQSRRDAIAARLGAPLKAGYICDVRDFTAHPQAALFVNTLDPILADADVRVVVETIGGAGVALEYVKRALESGRHVVTSNKELVAAHGAQLLALAKEKNVAFLFEASVGGGTPIIMPLSQSLAGGAVRAVAGIVNGTTNFMLTRMAQSGLLFDDALKEAQALGYAETINPSYDVDGLDAGRKIAILASLAFGSHVYPQNVYTRGIRDITPADIAAARAQNAAIKLLAYARKEDGEELVIGVEPMLVPCENQLAGVQDVYNAVTIDSFSLGTVAFYGKGAGRLPTASAVVGDALCALERGARVHQSLFWRPALPMQGLYPAYKSSRVHRRAQGQALQFWEG